MGDYYDLGSFTWPITTKHVSAQVWFDRGMAWCYGFNHDEAIAYDEPWGWMQPTRHALGALLSEQGRYDEAEAVYRADLGLDGSLRRACQHPDNVWSLHGLHECLARRGHTAEAPLVKQRLDLALARTDVPVKASCYCRRS